MSDHLTGDFEEGETVVEQDDLHIVEVDRDGHADMTHAFSGVNPDTGVVESLMFGDYEIDSIINMLEELKEEVDE